MNQPVNQPEAIKPFHTHYVSLENGAIYPALTSPAGYEDAHLNEYRPATAAEIDKYVNGGADIVEVPFDFQTLGGPASGVAAPATLLLQPEDPPVIPPAPPVIPPAPPVIPPAPTSAIPPAVPPAPPLG